jgi:hypothetical protein
MTSQHGAYALHAGLARLYGRMRMHTFTRPGIHMHARTRTHAHTGQCVILIAFPQQQWFRERVSLLRYTYIACLVPYNFKLFQMQMKSKYCPTVLNRELNSSKSNIVVRKIMYCLKCDNIGLTPFCFSGPAFILNASILIRHKWKLTRLKRHL